MLTVKKLPMLSIQFKRLLSLKQLDIKSVIGEKGGNFNRHFAEDTGYQYVKCTECNHERLIAKEAPLYQGAGQCSQRGNGHEGELHG